MAECVLQREELQCRKCKYDKKLHLHVLFYAFFNCKDNFKFRLKANHSYHS